MTAKIDKQGIAEHVRKACIGAAREAFMDASAEGLCSEGAMEAAVSAMQSLDLDNVLDRMDETRDPAPGKPPGVGQ
jgi:hypothetical protein